MRSARLLVDAFGRIREETHAVVAGLGPDQLAWRPDGEANTIAWLVWHLTRIQDDHLAGAFGTDQVWTSGGWTDRCDLPFDVSATGYGQSADDVAAVRLAADLLTDYHDAVQEQTAALLHDVTDDDLDRVVGEHWDPPVTLGVRLVSVLSDGLQHVGQAGYVRGLVERLSR